MQVVNPICINRRLMAQTAQGGVINALAKEGGLDSTFWAGPENLTKRMKQGEVNVQGSSRQNRARLRLGFSSEDFSYAIALGLPVPSNSVFSLDPEIKNESIWVGNTFRPASALLERKNSTVKVRHLKKWEVISKHTNNFDSIFSQVADPVRTPEVVNLRDRIRNWRFYDHFRTDKDAPARQPQLGTRTPILADDGHNLAAALQTIKEIGDNDALNQAISDAFPGAKLHILIQSDGRFSIELSQYVLLRPLSGFELSDGTLRYLLWIAALLAPRPPPLMVLNEPETSLHPDLLPALARLIIKASQSTQVWVVSHASRLISALEKNEACHCIALEKELGQTKVVGQSILDEPLWKWPDNGI